jgi:lipopolysaccharide export system permease protein
VLDAIYDQNYHISMKKIVYRKIAGDCVKFFLLTIFTISTIIWVLQAVNFLDFVIEDGHGFFVYFKYTLLNLPKIFGKIFPFAMFFSFAYILTKYESKNELIIFWNHGINKIQFINFFVKLSFGFIILNLLLNTLITPLSQDKARSFIRSSDLDFFESMLKPKKFIDVIKNLTIYFEEKDELGQLKNIYLKDNNNGKDFQITFAKTGKFQERENKRILVLYNGVTLNNQNGNLSKFNFTKSDYNISKFNSKTISATKTQENSTIKLLQCILILEKEKNIEKNLNKTFSFENCRLANFKNIYQEIYKRIITPFYNVLLIMISLLLIMRSKDTDNYKLYKLKIYMIGFISIIFLEISLKFITSILLKNLLVSLLPLFFFFILYSYFLNKLKFQKQ